MVVATLEDGGGRCGWWGRRCNWKGEGTWESSQAGGELGGERRRGKAVWFWDPVALAPLLQAHWAHVGSGIGAVVERPATLLLGSVLVVYHGCGVAWSHPGVWFNVAHHHSVST